MKVMLTTEFEHVPVSPLIDDQNSVQQQLFLPAAFLSLDDLISARRNDTHPSNEPHILTRAESILQKNTAALLDSPQRVTDKNPTSAAKPRVPTGYEQPTRSQTKNRAPRNKKETLNISKIKYEGKKFLLGSAKIKTLNAAATMKTKAPHARLSSSNSEVKSSRSEPISSLIFQKCLNEALQPESKGSIRSKPSPQAILSTKKVPAVELGPSSPEVIILPNLLSGPHSLIQSPYSVMPLISSLSSSPQQGAYPPILVNPTYSNQYNLPGFVRVTQLNNHSTIQGIQYPDTSIYPFRKSTTAADLVTSIGDQTYSVLPAEIRTPAGEPLFFEPE